MAAQSEDYQQICRTASEGCWKAFLNTVRQFKKYMGKEVGRKGSLQCWNGYASNYIHDFYRTNSYKWSNCLCFVRDWWLSCEIMSGIFTMEGLFSVHQTQDMCLKKKMLTWNVAPSCFRMQERLNATQKQNNNFTYTGSFILASYCYHKP